MGNTSTPIMSGSGLSPAIGQWYAVHTRCRHEKSVEGQLAQKQISTFVPTVRETHRWSDRQKTVEVPLFSCYVFVRIPDWRHAYYPVLHTPGVCNWVGRQGEPAPITDPQIEAVRATLASGLAASPYPFLNIGQRVRVRGGALDGLEGVLAGRNRDCRLVLSIDLIQQSMAVVLEGYEVVPV